MVLRAVVSARALHSKPNPETDSPAEMATRMLNFASSQIHGCDGGVRPNCRGLITTRRGLPPRQALEVPAFAYALIVMVAPKFTAFLQAGPRRSFHGGEQRGQPLRCVQAFGSRWSFISLILPTANHCLTTVSPQFDQDRLNGFFTALSRAAQDTSVLRACNMPGRQSTS